MKIVFSIIVPVYKVEQYLCDCLDSLLIGQGDNYEVIAINDCSPDGSLDILREYEKKHSNLKIVDFEQNQGVSAARNAGLEVARGEWILFCDSDDVFMPGALPFLQEKIREKDCDIVTFELARVKSVTESVPGRMEFDDAIHDMSDHEDAAAFVRENFPHRLWAWNKCFKRELIGGLRFRNFQPCEDAIWVLECMCKAKKILELPDMLYKYLQHEGSCLKTISPKRLNGDIQGMRCLCDVILQWRFSALMKDHAYKCLRDVFLKGIAWNFVHLKTDQDTTKKIQDEYFDAALYAFAQSGLAPSVSCVFYRILLSLRSVMVVRLWFRMQSCVMRIGRHVLGGCIS